MSLETGTYPSDFVLTNPTSGDPKSQGDDHLRLIKTCTQNALPVAAAVYPLTSGTAVVVSGTAVNFTSIPSWVKRITFSFASLSTNGTSPPIIQLGDSGGYETSGYLCGNTIAANGNQVTGANATTGLLLIGSVAAASISHGVATLTLLTATNGWSFAVAGGFSNAATSFQGGGVKSLSGTLDRLRLTTVNGTDTFDSGTVNILYE